MLEKSARKLRKICKDKTPSRPKGKKHIKNSYKLSKVQRSSDENYIEMTNKSPHFHLIERGHNLVSRSGEKIGFIPGAHMVERGTEEFREEFPEIVEKMVAKMKKKV